MTHDPLDDFPFDDFPGWEGFEDDEDNDALWEEEDLIWGALTEADIAEMPDDEFEALMQEAEDRWAKFFGDNPDDDPPLVGAGR